MQTTCSLLCDDAKLAGSLIKQYYNMMSDPIFVLSDQNGDLVGHMSFQEKKLFAALPVCSRIVMQSKHRECQQRVTYYFV